MISIIRWNVAASDRKEFRLGLSELETVGKDSLNKRLLDDYSIWFVNSH